LHGLDGRDWIGPDWTGQTGQGRARTDTVEERSSTKYADTRDEDEACVVWEKR